MANQGRSLTGDQISRITRLLSSTDMTIGQIAERMGCSRSAIVGVNRKHSIRDYCGQRSQWTVRMGKEADLGYASSSVRIA
jgi:IS30 family transposase